MLGDKKLKAFVPATDADKARTFYEDILGLTLYHKMAIPSNLIRMERRIAIPTISISF